MITIAGDPNLFGRVYVGFHAMALPMASRAMHQVASDPRVKGDALD
jgi:hypothetical protein